MKAVKQNDAAFNALYRSKFAQYTTAPNFNKVTAKSATVSYTENASVALYLNQCETGKSEVQYQNGSTYFVFSGTKDNKCVFYVQTQRAPTDKWDGILHQKCIWDISTDKDDTPLFAAGPNGIEFGNYVDENCKSI